MSVLMYMELYQTSRLTMMSSGFDSRSHDHNNAIHDDVIPTILGTEAKVLFQDVV